MQLLTDIDGILLLAVALASKRRPADLATVMAATDLEHGALAAEFKLTDAFHRLSTNGLICQQGEGIALTEAGEAIMAVQPKKAPDILARLGNLKATLRDYHATGEDEPIGITVEQVRAAVSAHRNDKRTPAKNMLLPKPKPADDDKKKVWRKGLRKPRKNLSGK